MSKLRKVLKWEAFLILVLLLEIIIFGIINPRFLNVGTLLSSVNDFVCISIIALFETFVIITGGIDISIGSIVGLTSTVMGVAWKMGHVNIWATIILGLLIGLACGAFNGALIAFTGVQAMVVTLGGMLLYSGIALVIMGMSGASASEGISGLPDSFVNISNGSLFGIPNLFIALILFTVIAYIILHKTKYGRYVFLVGINNNTARYSGIHAKLVMMSTYIFSGVGASIAGIIITSYIGGSRPDLGSEYTMPIITAVVLGGTAITGGKGGVIGTAIASVVVGILNFGLQMANVPSQYINVGTGILLVVVVAARGLSQEDSFMKKLIQRYKSSKKVTG